MQGYLLFIFFIACQVIFAQNEFSPKYYVDTNAGLLIIEGDDIHAGLNLSAGYRFNRFAALGLAYNLTGVMTLSTSRAVSGFSLEPRFSFHRFQLKLNNGLVINAKLDEGECLGKRIKTTNYYFRPALEYHLGVFTIGLSAMFAPNLKFRLEDFNMDNPSGFCNSDEVYELSPYDSKFLFISIGLSFPKYKKKN